MPQDKFAGSTNPFKSEDVMTPLKLTSGAGNPFDKYRSKASDLKTPQGLYDLAKEAGFEQEADTAVRRAGGENMKFLSGGFVMDTMDWLNMASYGIVGLVKGKGFVEGIKNRETLADDDALGKYGFLGKVAGFVGDILLDPLTYVAPIKLVSKIPGVTKLASAAKVKLLGELETIEVNGQKTFKREGGWTPLTFLSDKLVYGFAVSKEYMNGIGKIAGRNEAIAGEADKLMRGISNIDPKIFARTLSKDETGRMISSDIKDLELSMKREGLDADFEKVKSVYDMRDNLMQKLIDLKVIRKETADEHWGTYLKQSYDEFIEAKDILPKKGLALNNKARVEGLTPEMMEDLGQVEDAGVLWATTLIKQVQLIKNAETQKFISDGYAITSDMVKPFLTKGGKLQDLHAVPDDAKRYGELAGKYVSKDIWDTVKGVFDQKREIGESLVMKFKHAKVIWNPGSHVRNAFSASIQNWWKMGLGPWRVDVYYDALKEFKSNGKYIHEMRELGFNERSGYINELVDNYLNNKELMGKVIKSQVGGSAKKFGKHIDRMLMNSYGHVDNVAKVAAYKTAIKKGVPKEEAYAQAMAATFNYSEVTPFVHQMRRAIWGVPFITFALKAAPLTGETLLKSPGKISVFGKARNSLFQAAGIDGEQEAEALPDYMRDDMFVMRLPWKDANGRSMYFDLSYIIPFGALADGSFLKNPMTANPVVGLVRELSRNETFSGSKIFNESDDISTVLTDVTIHVGKLGLPPSVTDFLPDGYNTDGTRKTPKMGWGKLQKTNTQDLGPGERSFYQEAARLIGVGAVPYELNSRESSLAYTQRDNLTKMLQENGILKTFEAGYLSKDSEFRPENQGFGGTPIYDRETRPIGR